MTSLQPAGCTRCGGAWLVPPGRSGACPSCAEGSLEERALDAIPEAELAVPRRVDGAEAARRVAEWSAKATFPPKDLRSLASRLEAAWWPMWLVDGTLVGTWQAEAGADYEVQSTRERFSSGQWVSEPITETRIRWSPAAGAILRRVDNVEVPALERWSILEDRAGAWPIGDATRPGPLEDLVRLPELSTDAAFPGAELGFKRVAGELCHAATGADHLRSFALTATYEGLHWTLLLVPVWTTWYADDDGTRWPVVVHGSLGRVSGPRIQSAAAGRRRAALLAGIGLSLLAVGVIGSLVAVLFPPAWLFTVPLALIGLIPAIAAIPPLFTPARHNAAERKRWG